MAKVAYYPFWPAIILSLTNSVYPKLSLLLLLGLLGITHGWCKWLDSYPFKVYFLSIQTMTLLAIIGDLQQVTLEIHNIFSLYSKILIQSLASYLYLT